MLSKNKDALLSLIRLGIGHQADILPQAIDWQSLKGLAEKQGLSAIVLDGLEALRSKENHNLPGKVFLTQWIGEVLQNYEYRYEQYCHAIAEMALFYNSHGYKMMVLKGYACSLDWPKPKHRPCGDIDIWQFGDYKKADEMLSKEKGIKIDNSHQHHTVFTWGNFSVENHYDFNNVYHHRSNAELEKIFKELGKDVSYSIEIEGNKVYLPSPNLHALFLLKHSMTDFAAFYVTLRQVLDWAFHVKKYHDEIDWKWLERVMEQFHMKEFFNCINAICVEDLGFDTYLFNGVKFNPNLKDKVLADILEPKYPREEPKFLIPRMRFKYRRWKGNAWKHQMCYNESIWSAFWSGMWNHLLKPASI